MFKFYFQTFFEEAFKAGPYSYMVTNVFQSYESKVKTLDIH